MSEEGHGHLTGSWALWHTALVSAFDAAETVLDLGVDANEVSIIPSYREGYPNLARNNMGTVLHAAVSEGQSRFSQWLLQKGVRLEVKDEHGRTTIDMTLEERHSDIQEMLNAWGTTHQSAMF